MAKQRVNVKRLTKLQILAETVAAYKRKPRAVSDNLCCFYYDPETGNKCAVGRCLKNPKKLAAETEIVTEIWHTGDPHPPNVIFDQDLKPKYRGHSFYFWRDLQLLHDDDIFWNGSNLSSKGKQFYNSLREKWRKSSKSASND